eukprot:15470335-Alexandrium_andersonii.AAC.1
MAVAGHERRRQGRALAFQLTAAAWRQRLQRSTAEPGSLKAARGAQLGSWRLFGCCTLRRQKPTASCRQ